MEGGSGVGILLGVGRDGCGNQVVVMRVMSEEIKRGLANLVIP